MRQTNSVSLRVSLPGGFLSRLRFTSSSLLWRRTESLGWFGVIMAFRSCRSPAPRTFPQEILSQWGVDRFYVRAALTSFQSSRSSRIRSPAVELPKLSRRQIQKRRSALVRRGGKVDVKSRLGGNLSRYVDKFYFVAFDLS